MARLLNMRPDAETEPHLGAHLTFLKQRNQRPTSIRERRLTILRVTRWLGHPVADVTADDLKRWQLSRGMLTPASMHNAICHLSRYLDWLHKQRLRADNPIEALVRPQHVHNQLPRPMADADIIAAIAAADEPVRVWLRLGALCGLRCMEIADLTRASVIPGPPSFLRVIGKGNKERLVSLPAALLRELQTGPFAARGYLFTRMDGRPGPPSAVRVSERINDHLHALGIEGTAHALRHRFGTKLYEETTDPFLVADEMGHGSINTTRGYVRLTQRANDAVEAISHLVA